MAVRFIVKCPLVVRQQKILRTPVLYHINGNVITLMFSGLFMCPGGTRLYVMKHGNVTEANLSRNGSGVSSLYVTCTRIRKKASPAQLHVLQADAHIVAANSRLRGHPLTKYMDLSI
jgi:hypothetical protein